MEAFVISFMTSVKICGMIIDQRHLSNFSDISWQEQATFWWGVDVSFVLTSMQLVLAHWNNSPRVDKSLHSWHIIPIQSQPVFTLTPYFCTINGEATNANFIVFGWTRPGR